MADGDVRVEKFDPDSAQGTPTETPAVEPNAEPNSNNQSLNIKTPDQEAHDAEMIQKADKGLDTGKDAQVFGGKYASQEEYDKAILEAFKKKHGDKLDDAYKDLAGNLKADPTPEAEPETEPEEKPVETSDADNDDVDQSDNTDESDTIVTDVNLDNFVTEFTTDGRLSDASYETLKTAGFDKGMVDTYMHGVTAQRDSLFAICEGQDGFFQMTEWAGEQGGYSEDDIADFNANLNSGEMPRMKRAVENLKLRFEAAGNKTAPTKIVEATSSEVQGNSNSYSSMREMIKDQENPLYDKSPDFRAMVLEKVKNSKW